MLKQSNQKGQAIVIHPPPNDSGKRYLLLTRPMGQGCYLFSQARVINSITNKEAHADLESGILGLLYSRAVVSLSPDLASHIRQITTTETSRKTKAPPVSRSLSILDQFTHGPMVYRFCSINAGSYMQTKTLPLSPLTLTLTPSTEPISFTRRGVS